MYDWGVLKCGVPGLERFCIGDPSLVLWYQLMEQELSSTDSRTLKGY